MERRTIDECARFKEPLPEAIRNRPKLFLGLALYFNAWFELDVERNHYNGLQFIKRSQMHEYAVDYDFDEVQTEDLIYYIRYLDNEHLKRLKAKEPPPSNAGSKRKKGFG